MRGSVARNETFSLIWRYYGLKGTFFTIGEHLYIFYYPIKFYQWIKVYRAEIMDKGKISLNHWCQGNMQMQSSQ